MSTHQESPPIEQLMTEADTLVEKILSDAIAEMEEEQRLQFEIQAQRLARIKSEMQDEEQDRIAKSNAAKMGSGATGIHEALLDIVKAMRSLSKSLS